MQIKIKTRPVGYPIGSNMSKVKNLVQEYVKGFKELNLPKDLEINLWCRGSSGAILAAIFALYMENPVKICHIKKRGESSHCEDPESFEPGYNIVIDDFVASGETIKSIIQHLKNNDFKRDCLIVMDGEMFVKYFDNIITNH